MFTCSPNVSRSLLAGVTAIFLTASAPSAQAAWFSWGKTTPAPATSEAPVVMAQADADRFNSLEAQMRNLTGQIEELTFQLKTVQDQLKRLQEDSDFRFRELEGGTAAAKGAPAVNEPPAAQATTKLPPAEQPVAEALPAQGDVALGEPPKALGTLTLDAPPSAEPPLDLSTLANGNEGGAAVPGEGVAVASIAPTGDARADYDQAYKLINAGRYDLAEAAFRQFLTTYPKDELAPDAQYWLGESLYNHGDYASAAEEFKNGYTKYPKAKRAPDTLLKLGLSLAGLGFRDDACKMYAAALSKYPQMSNGLRQRVKTEQASAAC